MVALERLARRNRRAQARGLFQGLWPGGFRGGRRRGLKGGVQDRGKERTDGRFARIGQAGLDLNARALPELGHALGGQLADAQDDGFGAQLGADLSHGVRDVFADKGGGLHSAAGMTAACWTSTRGGISE